MTNKRHRPPHARELLRPPCTSIVRRVGISTVVRAPPSLTMLVRGSRVSSRACEGTTAMYAHRESGHIQQVLIVTGKEPASLHGVAGADTEAPEGGQRRCQPGAGWTLTPPPPPSMSRLVYPEKSSMRSGVVSWWEGEGRERERRCLGASYNTRSFF
jgi:hypothetical protein